MLSPEEQRPSRSSRNWDYTRGAESPLPPPSSTPSSSSHRPQQQRSLARSVHGDESEDSDHEASFHRNPSGASKKSKERVSTTSFMSTVEMMCNESHRQAL